MSVFLPPLASLQTLIPITGPVRLDWEENTCHVLLISLDCGSLINAPCDM